jgi:hypothetical protein
VDFHHNLDHQKEGLEEGPRVEEGPNAAGQALAALSAHYAFSFAVQIVGEHCDQQEIFSSDLLSVPLLCEHQEAHLVSPQLYHHLMQQGAHFQQYGQHTLKNLVWI